MKIWRDVPNVKKKNFWQNFIKIKNEDMDYVSLVNFIEKSFIMKFQ